MELWNTTPKVGARGASMISPNLQLIGGLNGIWTQFLWFKILFSFHYSMQAFIPSSYHFICTMEINCICPCKFAVRLKENCIVYRHLLIFLLHIRHYFGHWRYRGKQNRQNLTLMNLHSNRGRQPYKLLGTFRHFTNTIKYFSTEDLTQDWVRVFTHSFNLFIYFYSLIVESRL